MAVRVRVRDFQSIVDGEILIDGFTVVTGTNNAGKSAFFRALKGVFTNARGSNFVRVGRPHCTVDLTFDDGQTLSWEKGPKVNRYVINGKVFDRVGHGVPPEVAAFGVVPVIAGNNLDLWPQIASQVTGVSFLLDQPGSVIAEAVADVERVNQLNRALKNCDSDRRSTRSELKLREKDRKDLETKMLAFNGLDDVLQKLGELEAKREDAVKLKRAISNLESLKQRYRAAVQAVNDLEGLDAIASLIPTDKKAQEIQQAARDLEGAQDLAHRHESARRVVGALDGLEEALDLFPTSDRVKYVEKFRQALQITVGLALQYENAQRDYEAACSAQNRLGGIEVDPALIQKAEKLSKALGNLRSLKKRYVSSQEDIEKLERALEALKGELDKANEEAAEVLGTYEVCPTCGSGLHGVH